MQIKINKTWTLINYSFYVAALAKQKLGSWSAKPTNGAAHILNIIWRKKKKNKCWYTSYFVRWVLYLRDSMQKLWILLKMQTKERNSFWFKYGAESDRINRECAFYVLCTSSVMSVYAFCLLFTTNNERNIWNLLLENILSRTFFWLLSIFFSRLFCSCVASNGFASSGYLPSVINKNKIQELENYVKCMCTNTTYNIFIILYNWLPLWIFLPEIL